MKSGELRIFENLSWEYLNLQTMDMASTPLITNKEWDEDSSVAVMIFYKAWLMLNKVLLAWSTFLIEKRRSHDGSFMQFVWLFCLFVLLLLCFLLLLCVCARARKCVCECVCLSVCTCMRVRVYDAELQYLKVLPVLFFNSSPRQRAMGSSSSATWTSRNLSRWLASP